MVLFMQRSIHWDPKGLGLLAPGNDVAVVVREHHDWLVHQRGIEDPLAVAEEVVAVD
jgi:hypothetical protein